MRVKNLDSFCQECNCSHFVYKYASLMGISDRSEYLEGMAFGDFLNTIFGKSAADMNQIQREGNLQEHLNQYCKSQEYLFALDFIK